MPLAHLLQFIMMIGVPVTFDYPFITVHSEIPALYIHTEKRYFFPEDGSYMDVMEYCTGTGEVI